MDEQILSREYLQGLQEKMKKQHKEQCIKRILQLTGPAVERMALIGKTSYIYDMNDISNIKKYFQNPLPTITASELIAAFQDKFPGCQITQEEIQTDVNTNTRIVKNVIIIDWS